MKEDKYIVLKLEDVYDFLTEQGRLGLMQTCDYIKSCRRDEGREPEPRYIVCNQDEPYAGAVWRALLDGEEAKQGRHSDAGP